MCPGEEYKLLARRMTTWIPYSGLVLTVCTDTIEENVSKRLELIHNCREAVLLNRTSERLCCLQFRQEFLEPFSFMCFK
jgi:hypothetical protein